MPKKEQDGLKLKVIGLSVGEGDINWLMKVKAISDFNESKNSYKMSILVDDEFFTVKKVKIQEEIAKIEAEPDLFENWKEQVKDLKADIKDIEAEKAEVKKLEVKEFEINVLQVDYTKSTFSMRIPEANIIDIVTIREKFEMFIVHLK